MDENNELEGTALNGSHAELKKQQEQEYKTIKGMFDTWISNTAMHGIGHIYGGPSRFRRVAWFILVTFSLSFLIYQLTELMFTFKKHDTNLVVKYQSMKNVPFPTVTICAIGGISRQVLGKFPDIQEHFRPFLLSDDSYDYEVEENLETKSGNFSQNATLDSGKSLESYILTQLNSSDSSTPEPKTITKTPKRKSRYENRLLFDYLFTKLTALQKEKILNESYFILKCEFMNKRCDKTQFTAFNSVGFGTCLSFNADGSKFINNIGPETSLSITLASQEGDTLASLAKSYGIKVIIHSATDIPFPDSQGMVLNPGTNTFLGLKLNHETLAKAPYGDCIDYHSDDFYQKGIMSNYFPKATYSQAACVRNCIQYYNIRHAKCYDPEVWLSPYYAKTLNVSSCNVVNKTLEFKILNEKRLEIQRRCFFDCPVQCIREYYDYDAYTSSWPSTPYYTHYFRGFLLKRPKYNRTLSQFKVNKTEIDYIRNNMLCFRIYLTSLKQTIQIDTPLYNWNRLLSDFGGQVGLWLGFSLVAVFELIELGIDILRFTLRGITKPCRCKKKKKKKNGKNYEPPMTDV